MTDTRTTTRFREELRSFAEFGAETDCDELAVDGLVVPTFTNEFWTSAQREGHSLHEISYRACFKPSLPAFFIDRLTAPGDEVLDPFMGRGTTVLEAALRARIPYGNDVNPLSAMLVRPRLDPPELAAVERRLSEIPFDGGADPVDADDLLAFFHPETLRRLEALRSWFRAREAEGCFDAVDDWIRMVSLNRLTGHSAGFFSVYTMPPNQAVSASAQRRINARRRQEPPVRDVTAILRKKTASLLRDGVEALAPAAVLSTDPADAMSALGDASIQLVVTSPPFLDVVHYAADNWLRCWFAGIDVTSVPITMARSVEAWRRAMAGVFAELFRVVRPGGWVAFEVGEVRKGKLRLEEAVIPVAASAGFVPELVMVNAQEFTKTANCWGVENNRRGTNTNRIVLLRRPG